MNDINEIKKNIDNTLLAFAEKLVNVLKSEYANAIASMTDAVLEFLQSIPDDVKDTELFERIQKIPEINIRYEDVKWLLDEYWLDGDETSIVSSVDTTNDELILYLKEIVYNKFIRKREKVVILLAHMETLIYRALKAVKDPKVSIKTKAKEITIEENSIFSAENVGKVFVLGITKIVYANTNNFTVEIDKRIPFRNHILHNGIVTYSDEDIEQVYEMLIAFISVLIQITKI